MEQNNNIPISSIIRYLISHNLKACQNQNGYMNQVHFTVWSNLKFLSECDTFTLIDNKEKSQNQKYSFMLEIFRNNIKDIISYLIYDKVFIYF